MPEVVFHRLDHNGVLRRLREFAALELAARPEVREVVLIGSLARGNWSARSDADLVVIVDQANDRPRDRAPRYTPRGLGLPVDVLVYTSEEARAWPPRFRREAEAGLVLWRRPDAH